LRVWFCTFRFGFFDTGSVRLLVCSFSAPSSTAAAVDSGGSASPKFKAGSISVGSGLVSVEASRSASSSAFFGVLPGVAALAVRPDVPALVRIAPGGDSPLSEANSRLLELGVALAEAAEPCLGFLQRESFSTEIIESISLEDLQPTVKIYVDRLQSMFIWQG